MGGAIYLNNPEYASLIALKFEGNIAKNDSDVSLLNNGYGGALYFTCDSTYNCVVNITKKTYFINNTAENSGGAIKWDQVEPKLANDTILTNNHATLYGNDIASYAQMIIMISE